MEHLAIVIGRVSDALTGGEAPGMVNREMFYGIDMFLASASKR